MARQSDLTVITKAKELCGYIMTVTQKSPKQFRFSLVSRLQGYALDIVASFYRANEVYLSGPDVAVKARVRLDYQHEALTSAKLLGYVAQLSMEQGAILPKQLEVIARLLLDTQNLCGAWITSDRKRLPP
jgi:hypothetical protein